MSDFSRWVRRGAAAAIGVAVVAVGIVLLWRAATVLVVVFGGVIIALAVRGAAQRLTAVFRMPERLAVLVISITIIAGLAVLGWLLADQLATQFQELAVRLPRAVARLEQQVAGHAWGRLILDAVPSSLTGDLQVLSATSLTKLLGASVGAVVDIGIAGFVAIYVALDPDVYRRGALALVPRARRARAAQALSAVAFTLRRWFVGRLIAMVVIGTLTAVGLWAIGVPLVATLALLAGVLAFVPYIGALLSFVPAVLMALLQGPAAVLWVVALYLMVHLVEGYIVTPLVQQQTVRLPPALTITAQVVLSVLLGLVGLLFATPLTAAIAVFVQLFYVEDLLHEDADVRGATSRTSSVA